MMVRTTRPSRRAVALILVLMLLVAALSATAALAALAAAHRTGADDLSLLRRATQLRTAADAPIAHWLVTSRAITLPLEVRAPRAPVLDDVWTADGRRHHVRITAFDQAGMPSMTAVRRAAPIRATVPARIRDAVLRLPDRPDVTNGLDLFDDPGLPIFPAAEPDGPALGAHIATHPTGGVNVNTAPWPLVEATARLLGRTGALPAIESARRAGRPLAFAATPAPPETPHVPTLVAFSSCWAVRIDIAVGPVDGRPIRRSWWCVYQQRGGQWRCAQRLAIDR